MLFWISGHVPYLDSLDWWTHSVLKWTFLIISPPLRIILIIFVLRTMRIPIRLSSN